MRLLGALLLLAASWTSVAADRTYAVISLVGDRLLISQYQPETGSRVNRNARTYVDLKTDALDRASNKAVRAALAKADPGAKVDLISANGPVLYGAANQALEQDAGPRLVAALAPDLKGLGATHWIIVSKFRGDTRVQIQEGTTGSGQLEGLGFYIDRSREMRNLDTGEYAEGFLSPFAYLRYTLVDAASGKVLAEQKEFESLSVIKQTAVHPWDALSADDKVRYLEQLIERAAADAVAKIVTR